MTRAAGRIRSGRRYQLRHVGVQVGKTLVERRQPTRPGAGELRQVGIGDLPMAITPANRTSVQQTPSRAAAGRRCWPTGPRPPAFWMQTAVNRGRITAVCIQNAEKLGKRMRAPALSGGSGWIQGGDVLALALVGLVDERKTSRTSTAASADSRLRLIARTFASFHSRLPGNPRIPGESRPDTRHLVGGYRCPGAGPAHDDAKLRLSVHHRTAHRGTDFWPFTGCGGLDDVMTARPQPGQHGPCRLVLVVRSECNSHRPLQF